MPKFLLKEKKTSLKRNLVFTSAGKQANLKQWVKGDVNFDLWICYYGEQDKKYLNIGDYYCRRKGGKFPNFHFIYHTYREIIDKYDAIMVMDDDIMISGESISVLFDYREKFNLWIIQPAFSKNGKISHPITRVKHFAHHHYTNFIEVTCPLFKKNKLDLFMEIYNPELIGWGVDHWFVDVLTNGEQDKLAVIDAISCVNPKDKYKQDIREIDILQKKKVRMHTWKTYKKDYNIKQFAPTQYKIVWRPFTPVQFLTVMVRICKEYYYAFFTEKRTKR